MEIENLGISGAYSFDLGTSDRSFSVGLGVSRYKADLAMVLGEFLSIAIPDRPTKEDIRNSLLPGGFYGPADYYFSRLLQAKFVEDSATSYGYHLGVLSRFGVGGRWSLGAVYRKGPKFDMDGQILIPLDLNTLASFETREAIHVPDIYGIGLAHSFANGRTRVAVDFDRIMYSQRFDDLVPTTTASSNTLVPVPASERRQYRIEDADEVHLGGEHIFLVVDSLFVATARLGAFYEPGHELEYLGEKPDLRQLYPKAKSDTHLAGGLGLVIKEDYQVDLAVDFSDRVDTVSLSLVKFF